MNYYTSTLFDASSRVSSLTFTNFSTKAFRKRDFAFDDKQYLIDAVRSYAYGHCKIGGDINRDDSSVSDQNEQTTVAVILAEDFVIDRQSRMLDEQIFVIDDFTITSCEQL